MKRVRYSDEALARIEEIHAWLVEQAGSNTADRVVAALTERCDSLATFPHRGTPRPESRPYLRTIPYKRRYVIGYRVDDGQVTILGILGAGQDLDVLTDD
ncbi:type II toxin-antitoxin system RelE/ParE family toxin [Sphingomonas sp. Leaf33]|uniref:type II toxin-antitoxin system RelE/ParE family toxin n=1 Tax=Sphingomonas sp. Leaf33 TaxID=1736215 RepID=UPI000B09463C|nr:type II toxin-antitoxin system RelE/ParE family toxin [Sphingomonas sp. Leaf33]